MKYILDTQNYCDFNTFEVNKLPARNYFIPYPSKETADGVSGREKRYKSSKVICLNGEWDFKFYEKPAELPKVLDTETLQFDKLDVPSCWQFRGYLKPFYVNVRYPFPYQPPKIPTLDEVGKTFCLIGPDLGGVGLFWLKPEKEYNSVGVYRRFFSVDQSIEEFVVDTIIDPTIEPAKKVTKTSKKGNKRYVLSFLGVASCVDVYVNGRFVGYSEGSHNTAEFDVTDYVTEGQNELVAVVHRWCNGTYLECQDMFRNNGIFRDVLLRVCEKNDIWDIDFSAKKTSEGSYEAVASAELYEDGEVTFTLEWESQEKNVRQCREIKVMSQNKKATVVFDNLMIKNAMSEDFTSETEQEDIFEIEEWNAEHPVLYNLYYEVEGSCIKTRVGFKDIQIQGNVYLLNGKKLKFHGVNHHDTSCTNGYTLSLEEIERDMKLLKEYNMDTVRTSHYPPDPYLLEVCDELGIYVVDEADLETHGTIAMKLPPSMNRISHDPKWMHHYLDRVQRLYQRDKMRTSVVMWSLGNEAGGYYNTDKMYDYLKERTTIPVHYEGVVHSKRKAYDIASQMYPTPADIHKVGEGIHKTKEFCDRPYFMCEYAHAMGVGPGDVESYWKEIYAYDNLCGGCVWEMVDHAVLEKDGSYTYGGDHGEWEHDSNFCVDGLFYPDRTPSTGAKIMKYIYRPIRVTYKGGDEFELFHTKAFTSGEKYRLRFCWNDGEVDEVIPRVEPFSKMMVKLDVKRHFDKKDIMVTVITTDEEGKIELAREQLILEESFKATPVDTGLVPLPENFQKETLSLKLGEEEMTFSNPYTILFRAPTDNDKDITMVSRHRPYERQKEEIQWIQEEDNRVTIVSKITCGKMQFTCTDTYEGSSEGILVTSCLHCDKGKGELPRFGKAFRLDASWTHVTYYGRSGESYVDMKDQFPIEVVECRVKDMTEPNIKPQESGNRCDCRYVTLSNGKEAVTFTAIDKAFELGVKPYSDTELLTMKHREDEVVTGTYVTISAFQMGIGTGICGPKTAPEYCYRAEEDYELKFLIQYQS